ncbi:replication factor-a protein 1 (rpa1) [Coccidioides immitis RS]|uniref:Replication protein A subunit n=2 Tax=Coccidioides immitis (strain RS) TaxID=246410 RepID=A0A0D8JWF8_COCIM|nr:replication factor-a protein 1 (rpa1) [Coccidioides immitis RS]KJF61637.1 replication factor-a protein 1 (rpa1) [Coccidioides immitis RS]TPX20129.1 Replication factor A protein 1 [Coccidioides immitis]
MANNITVGALSAIFDDTKEKVAKPIVQCLHVKLLSSPSGGPDRYRAVFSDISNFVQTMLASSLNDLVNNGALRRGCFVQLKSFQANFVKGKRILIVLDLDVLEDLGECERIGDPKPLETKVAEVEKPTPTAISSDGFYGVVSEHSVAQPQRHQRATVPTMAPTHANIYPIEALSPYSHKWTIKARCTNKSAIKKWYNRNGEGRLFSVNLLDDSGEIRATAFKEQCDLLYPLFEEGSVYYISSPCRVQMAKREFSNVNNDYELTFERDTVIERAEDHEDVPQMRFNFTSIGHLHSVEKGTTIDVLGVLKTVEPVAEVPSKSTGKRYTKRELMLVDDTGYSVPLTIWGGMATSFDVMPDSVVAFKGVKVSDFGGRSLSLLNSGTITSDPDIEEAHKLKGWYDAQGKFDQFATHALSENAAISTGTRQDIYKAIVEVRDNQLGMTEKPDYFSLRATVVFIKQDTICYPACVQERCNKKVVQVDPEQWLCEHCEKSSLRPEYRYILSANVSDHTGQLWLNCFDEVGRAIMGMPANVLMELKESDDKAASEAILHATCQMWNLKCKAKLDNFQNQPRVRYQVLGASPINFSHESSRLVSLIDSYGIEKSDGE